MSKLRILLQFAEGLKEKAVEYAKNLEKNGNEVFVCAAQAFGACDIALEEAKAIKAKKIIHFGHSKLIDIKEEGIEIEYVEPKIEIEEKVLKELIEEACKKIKFERIGLVTNISHVSQIEKIKEEFEKNGKKIFTQKGERTKEAQILGCDVSAAKKIESDVDAFVYFGGGLFHPLGALMATNKPFFVIDPFQRKIFEITQLREKYKRIRNTKISLASQAKKFGILVSTKPGQFNLELALKIKKDLEKNGKEGLLLIANTFNFDELSEFGVDAFINTSCPRISLEEGNRIKNKPILSVEEFYFLLKIS
ncbi:MAG: diphthamide biosynthesis enzyme Dph2 [Candidatus Micrarchaeia archaeon]